MDDRMVLRRIGIVCQQGGHATIRVDSAYRAALQGLDEFSHCHVLWWAGSDFGLGFDTRSVLHAELPYAPGRSSGVFANRGPFRPNPIGLTVCPIRRVDMASGTLEVAAIDALDGTVVVDVKAYYGCCDRVRSPRTPSWLPPWGEWVPDDGIRLEDVRAERCRGQRRS